MDRMAESVEAQTLRDVEEYPSTNITRILRHAGKTLPDSVGGGCLWMAGRITKLLRARRPHLKLCHYDLGEPGSHTTTVSDDGRERLLYEPSLYQIRPFSLTRFDADPRQCTSEAYPKLDANPMQLRYTRIPPESLRMELLSPRGTLKRAYTYLFRAPVSINEDDPYAGLPFIEPQDQLYVYTLNPEGSKSVLMLNVRTKRFNVGRVRDRLYVDSEPGFESRFEKIAARMLLGSADLRALMLEALEVHNAQYPVSPA